MPEQTVDYKSFQEKFEFYFIGLIFTLLGLTINTAKFTDTLPFAVYCELFGWTLLILSGLAGLSKLEWISTTLYVTRRHATLTENSTQIQLARAQGHTSVLVAEAGERRSIKEVTENLTTSINSCQTKLDEISKYQGWKYNIQKWGVVVGLVAIAVARGTGATVTLNHTADSTTLFQGKAGQCIKNSPPILREDMGVNLSSGDVFMPQQFLDQAEITTKFQEVGGKEGKMLKNGVDHANQVIY